MTATPTETPRPADTATATEAPTLTPSDNAPNEIEDHGVAPNPNPGAGHLALKLKGRVDEVELKVYLKSMTCIATQLTGPRNAGWCKVPLPAELMIQGNGLYYYRVKTRRGGRENQEPGIASFMIIR